MKYRTRIYYTEEQKALMWDRWQRGDSLATIARLFDREHSSVQRILQERGGIRPPQRRRSRRALTLSEREEISRGVAAGHSLRSIAASLGRSPSTVSREIERKVAVIVTEPVGQIKRRGIEHSGQSPVNWLSTADWPTSWHRSSDDFGRPSKLPAG